MDNKIIQIVILKNKIIGLSSSGELYVREKWEHGYQWKIMPMDTFDLEEFG